MPHESTASARTMMVDSQVRPNKVTDPRIISAMRLLPREAFLPVSLAARAYADDDVTLPRGRVMTSPMVIARLVQTANVRRGERALVVGCTTGYGAALLSLCGAQVTALEEDADLVAVARTSLSTWAPDVTLVTGPLVEGWKEAAPYDLVLIEGAVEALPGAIASQVNAQGRLVMVRATQGQVGQAVIGRPGPNGLSFAPAFDCSVGVLPAMRRLVEFVF